MAYPSKKYVTLKTPFRVNITDMVQKQFQSRFLNLRKKKDNRYKIHVLITKFE